MSRGPSAGIFTEGPNDRSTGCGFVAVRRSNWLVVFAEPALLDAALQPLSLEARLLFLPNPDQLHQEGDEKGEQCKRRDHQDNWAGDELRWHAILPSKILSVI